MRNCPAICFDHDGILSLVLSGQRPLLTQTASICARPSRFSLSRPDRFLRRHASAARAGRRPPPTSSHRNLYPSGFNSPSANECASFPAILGRVVADCHTGIALGEVRAKGHKERPVIALARRSTHSHFELFQRFLAQLSALLHELLTTEPGSSATKQADP